MTATLGQGNVFQIMLTGFAGIMMQILAVNGAEALVVAQGRYAQDKGSAKQGRRV